MGVTEWCQHLTHTGGGKGEICTYCAQSMCLHRGNTVSPGSTFSSLIIEKIIFILLAHALKCWGFFHFWKFQIHAANDWRPVTWLLLLYQFISLTVWVFIVVGVVLVLVQVSSLLLVAESRVTQTLQVKWGSCRHFSSLCEPVTLVDLGGLALCNSCM